ncbi:MAG: DivIVA domain-containing protein [Mogibacterium sp.]|nr:DivIVA domain-containing protein [Mogibacterium sp.]
MIMPIDIDKKEFSRDRKGYNSREVDEFLDIIVADYEKILNDNRQMAHKIKSLEAQLAEAQKDDGAMVETLETAKKLMADISASAERRAELMIRDAELEAENLLADAKMSIKKITDEHSLLSNKVRRLRSSFRRMLENELAKLDEDEFDVIKELDDGEYKPISEELESGGDKAPTIAINKNDILEAETAAGGGVLNTLEEELETPLISDLREATLSDLSESLKKMAEEPASITDTIILK